MSAVTTHVLDTTLGRPAIGIPVVLAKWSAGEQWSVVGRGTTDADGRVRDLLPAGRAPEPGVYRLTFDTAAYYHAQRAQTFFPEIAVTFEIREVGEHYHVPLLLSPYGYATYRGS